MRENENMTRALLVIDVQREYFDGAIKIGWPPAKFSLPVILEVIQIAQENSMPIIYVRHENPVGAAAFAKDSLGVNFHFEISQKIRQEDLVITKHLASAFDGTSLDEYLRQHDITAVTLVGYMTNNCIFATAEGAVAHGYQAEIISDACGAINISNELGAVSARQIQEVLLTVLHSNFAAITTKDQWKVAVQDGVVIPKSNLLASFRVDEIVF